AALRFRRTGGGGLRSDDPSVDAELSAQVCEELNVKRLERIPDASGLVERTLRPLLPVIGPRRGAAVAGIMASARAGDWQLLDGGRVDAAGVILEPDEFTLTARARPGHEVAEEGELLVALDTTIDADLEAEGLARELAHRLQGLRRAAGYEISDRIEVAIGTSGTLAARLEPHRAWLADELLATRLELGPEANLDRADRTEEAELDGAPLRLALRRA
ncbi:MAG: DUF5915 domain-containing protein, partial [Chloroflexota bacterium]|nr:DUF5915 domain-containing protein [Chloroflexota bacterium]